MGCGKSYETGEYDLVRLREERKEILDALEALFDLLEEYAPVWYTQEHRQTAFSALETAAGRDIAGQVARLPRR